MATKKKKEMLDRAKKAREKRDGIFKPIYLKARQKGFNSFSQASMKWYYDSLRGMTVSQKDIKDDSALRTRPDGFIGRIYMYNYSPIGAKEMPYYDSFPLIIFVGHTKNGFTGINLHYLHPYARAQLLDEIRGEFLSVPKKGRPVIYQTQLKVTYAKLKAASKYRSFFPAFKRYRYDRMRSPFTLVPPNHWESSLFLPSESFKKASQEQVWKESERIWSKL